MNRPIDVTRPTLILDRDRAIRNIERMATKARQSGVRFRPHFKTHQSREVGSWFREYGVDSITVSSVQMAEYFASGGWQDITIAFPVNWLQIDRINELAGAISLGLLVESTQTVRTLRQILDHEAKVWVEIDVGDKRTGVVWNDSDTVSEVVAEIAESANLQFSGVLTHSGSSYKSKSRADVIKVYQDTVHRMQQVRSGLRAQGYSPVELSIGDTPCCSLVDDFSEVDEVRPGAFVFYDVMQLSIGSCTEEDIAVAVGCPVVARYKDRSELAIYGGAVHLSKERITGPGGKDMYGSVALFGQTGWGPMIAGSYVSHLSQEHGIIKASDELFESVRVGDVLAVVPVHVCLTVNLMREYTTLNGQVIQCRIR